MKKTVGGTKEWSTDSVNCCTGCEHNCLYCYARAQLTRIRFVTVDGWKTPVIRPKDVNKRRGLKKGTVMFPTSHDIVPSNVDACLTVLVNLLRAGNKVLIVSKPHLDVIQRLCKELEPYKAQILFRFTIGSSDDGVLSFWEPGAPKFAERLASLQHAKARGFETSVSCEPMLDDQVDGVINAVRPHVSDSIWLGLPNMLASRVAINTKKDPVALAAARKLVGLFTEKYVKSVYEQYRHDSVVKYKDSMKKMLGLERPTRAGLDV